MTWLRRTSWIALMTERNDLPYGNTAPIFLNNTRSFIVLISRLAEYWLSWWGAGRPPKGRYFNGNLRELERLKTTDSEKLGLPFTSQSPPFVSSVISGLYKDSRSPSTTTAIR
ncbi:hypothetical protein PM082_018969 [Marasmius tenuissimus]|nr:hypothetical protein PM082_018969 [Marasmius tenuissimus]